MFRFLGDNLESQLLSGANKAAKTLGDISLPIKYQFILTLVKLRKNFQYEDISVRFGCQTKHGSQIFKVYSRL